MTEGTLLNWLKNVGDQISSGDIIAEIETDKATVEVPSEVSGTILELIGKPGDTLTVGSVIGYAGEPGEQPPSGGADQAAQDNGAAPAQQEAQPAGETAQAEPAPQAAQPAAAAAPETADGNLPDGVKASPIARRIARVRGIDLRQVKGTGPNGATTRARVEKITPEAAPAAAARLALPAATHGEIPRGPDVATIDTSRLRSRIAQRMVQSEQQAPHFYVTTEVD